MAIFLAILKWIGIGLLIILGLIILFLLLFLFLPFRYRVRAEGGSESGQYSGKADITWLLHLVHVIIFVEKGKGAGYSARVLGIQILPRKKRKKEGAAPDAGESPGEGESPPEVSPEPIESTGEAVAQNGLSQEAGQETASGDHIGGQSSTESQDTVAGSEIGGGPSSELVADEGQEGPKEKKGLAGKLSAVRDKIAGIFSKIKNGIQKLGCKIDSICDKIEQLSNKVEYYTDLMDDPHTRAAIELGKQQGLKLYRGIRPRKLRLRLRFGFKNPGITGQILAFTCLSDLLNSENVELEPDFEKRVMEGDLDMKGRVFVFTVLMVAIKLYFNKNVKWVLRHRKYRG
ncbi:MAG: hypothetical protein K5989_08470 [Lachnospiraceae bacterium]|nr:hypothetical protein [Lachnospiraceae bacterium]